MELRSASGQRSSEPEDLRIGRRRADRAVAVSPATKRAIDLAAAASRSEIPVLVWGPPGSGRSFVARAIHAWSSRAQGPFEEISCHAFPGALQPRALFDTREGAFARTTGGTLALDGPEVLVSEARRQIESWLGDRAGRPHLPRIVAIAEQPGEAASLFGSLPFHEIALAPLRERREEILVLASHFLAEVAHELGIRPVGFTREARAALLEEEWAGNLSELRERIRQAVRLSREGAVSVEALACALQESEIPSFRDAKRAFEARYVASLLKRCRGNVSEAARLARKDRKDFYDVIRRTGVRPSDFRS